MCVSTPTPPGARRAPARPTEPHTNETNPGSDVGLGHEAALVAQTAPESRHIADTLAKRVTRSQQCDLQEFPCEKRNRFRLLEDRGVPTSSLGLAIGVLGSASPFRADRPRGVGPSHWALTRESMPSSAWFGPKTARGVPKSPLIWLSSWARSRLGRRPTRLASEVCPDRVDHAHRVELTSPGKRQTHQRGLAFSTSRRDSTARSAWSNRRSPF